MARIFIDGFEAGQDDLWDAESNATVVASAGLDMDGSYCLDLNSLGEYLQKNITADDEMYAAVLWRPTNNASSKVSISFYKDGTLLVAIQRNATSDLIEAYRGTTLIDTGSISVPYNATYLIEVRVKIHDSTGVVQTKVDGISDIDFAGDTKVGADTQFNKVRLGFTAGGNYSYAYFDNLILDDAAWIGDTKIQAIVPTAAGNSTGWTPSAGSNYACVDEKPASDVDYVSINANDVSDTFTTGDMTGTIDSVKCVQIQSRTESDGAPTPTNLKLVARSSAVDYLSANKSVSASVKALCNLWETNPATSTAWTETTVNGVEIGIKSAA